MRHPILVTALLASTLTACGQGSSGGDSNLEQQLADAQARIQTLSKALKEAEDQGASDGSESLIQFGRMMMMTAEVAGDLAAMSRPGVTDAARRFYADRVLDTVGLEEDLLSGTVEGLRLRTNLEMLVAGVLAYGSISDRALANRLVQGAMERAAAANQEAVRTRSSVMLLADAHAGAGRLAYARGHYVTAVGEFQKAADLLLDADKGRGTGTGSGEYRGDAEGGGKGRSRGKGQQKLVSLSLKRQTTHVYRELALAHRALGNFQEECIAINKERNVSGGICKMEHGSQGTRVQRARLNHAWIVDRLGDATYRYGRAEDEWSMTDAALVEMTARRFMAEIAREAVDELIYQEAVIEQDLEIAWRLARLGQIEPVNEHNEGLRGWLATFQEDLQVYAQSGGDPDHVRSLDGYLHLYMGQGLGKRSQMDDNEELLAEANNFYGRVIELVEESRTDGKLVPEMEALEAAALAGMAGVHEDPEEDHATLSGL